MIPPFRIFIAAIAADPISTFILMQEEEGQTQQR
jgi:hypothetical protein